MNTTKNVSHLSARFGAILSLLMFAGCGLSDEDWSTLETMDQTSEDSLPPSPTNAWADDDDAALLGQALFFDERMSADGEVSCASCHDPANQFADPRPVSEGVEGRTGDRHAPTLINLAFQDFYFWDGRTDSLWSTPLQAIEAGPEADFTRVEVVRLLAAHYRAPYEAVFGPLPDVTDLPARARPGLADWDLMSEEQQLDVDRAFSNAGKALEAYQRKLVCNDTRFDRIVAGEESFDRLEEEGARQFVRSDEGNCASCHSGVNLSDNDFHRLPLPGLTGFPDEGRSEGVVKLLDNPFNASGLFSDDTGFGDERLAEVQESANLRGRFKTPTLRGVAQRRPLGHLGNVASLDDWLRDVYVRGGGRGRGGRRGGNNEGFDPEVNNLDFEPRAMAAFLRTMSCAPLPAELLQKPDLAVD